MSVSGSPVWVGSDMGLVVVLTCFKRARAGSVGRLTVQPQRRLLSDLWAFFNLLYSASLTIVPVLD